MSERQAAAQVERSTPKEADSVRGQLSRRSGKDWELYRKSGRSRELVATAVERGEAERREQGWAARWWEGGAPRFACASEVDALARSIEQAGRLTVSASAVPRWPQTTSVPEPPAGEVDPPPDVFGELARALSAESRGEALLSQLTVRRGRAAEWIENGAGLRIAQSCEWIDGVAFAIGRRGARACEARLVFRSPDPPDLAALARRLADRAILPLSERTTPIQRGEWLLDSSVAAAVLAGIAPLFCAAKAPRWLTRARLAAERVTIVDDATADASFDGEGTTSRRVLLVDGGDLVGTLHDLRSAARAGTRSTGHGLRDSYRVAPAVGPRRLFFETTGGAAPLELLSAVRRGLFAAALTSPARIDLEEDRFEIEFSGIALVAGRAQTPVAGARARGRISQLLRRISAVATDRQFFPMPFLTGSPTLLVERADFD